MTKAQDFIKEFAPECSGNDLIPFSKVLALMESFKSHCMIEYLDTLLKPKPSESVIIDAVIDEDKMTLPYKVGDRFTNGFSIYGITDGGLYLLNDKFGFGRVLMESELDHFTLIDNDFPHVEHTGI